MRVVEVAFFAKVARNQALHVATPILTPNSNLHAITGPRRVPSIEPRVVGAAIDFHS